MSQWLPVNNSHNYNIQSDQTNQADEKKSSFETRLDWNRKMPGC